jgi:hypothetical protein
VTITNPGNAAATLPNGFFADYLDVDGAHPFHDDVVAVTRHGITAGCGNGDYCPGAAVTREQMAVFLLKAEHGGAYAPPACGGRLRRRRVPGAVHRLDRAARGRGDHRGCGGGKYCPDAPVTRAQMAAFLLKTEHGAAYTPPACGGDFTDVACPSQFADWIEQLATEGVTAGCGGDNYCPDAPNTRGQMAVFLSRTFLAN